MFEKIVLVTRKTRLDHLVERFNTRAQARFYIEHAGGDFAAYEAEHAVYREAFDTLRRQLEVGLKLLVIDRDLLPTTLITEHDIVVALGQDGLVANVAKYAGNQPVLGVNPDPARFDGILLPFAVPQVRPALAMLLAGKARIRRVTMAEAALNDGQRMLAFNDLFIGAASHVSARYRIRWNGAEEAQSSSGILVSTGAGSTGWLSSVFGMASGVVRFLGGPVFSGMRMEWEEDRLLFVVREPFASRHSQAGIVMGSIAPGGDLVVESQMPSGGVIFSDGVEADRLSFDSGAVAAIRVSAAKATLVVQ
jgi:NAD kinase